MKLTRLLSELNFYKIFAFIWTGIIFYLCLDDAPNVPKLSFPFKDKVVHFIFYFVWVFTWSKSIRNSAIKLYVVILIGAILMGICIEFMQENCTMHRTFDYYDILANTLGALSAFIFFVTFYNKNRI